MSIKSLKLNFDCIAPDSENTMISKEIITELMKKYKNISVMFDNDEAGIKAMKKYKELYNFNVFLLPLSKDISDSIKDYGFKKVFYTFVPLINKSFDNGKS
jgi:DNA primase